MKKVFLHIGYPKCFSTTLQRNFLEKHPEIAFAGIGLGDNTSYANADIELTFECLLKYATHRFFMEHLGSARAAVARFIDEAGSKVVFFSSEHLSFPFTSQTVDIYQVRERTALLFEGYDLQVLLILRRQDALLRSLFGEYVKMGYPESFSTLVRHTWGYRDRNFFEALDYLHAVQSLRNRFGREAVHVAFTENWASEPRRAINAELSRVCGISDQDLPIGNANPGLTESQLADLLHRNRNMRREMGAHLLHSFENHRNRVVLDRLESGYDNDEVFADVLAKRSALARSKGETQQPSGDLYTLSPEAAIAMDRLCLAWGRTNTELRAELPNLPVDYTSFPPA